MSEMQQVRRQKKQTGENRWAPFSTVEDKKKWIVENWESIKNCLPDDVFPMMVKAGLYSKKSYLKDSVPVIEKFMNQIKR